MALSTDACKRLAIATADKTIGEEISKAINVAAGLASQGALQIPYAIVAAHTSTTTDFAALAVGDYVVCIDDSATTAIYYIVATAGTLPASAVVGSIYIGLRAYSAPSAVTITF